MGSGAPNRVERRLAAILAADIAGYSFRRGLGAIMVREEMAWAFVRYSLDYVDQEEKAKADRLGVHAHGCQPA